MALPDFLIEPLVRTALIEDCGLAGDVTAALAGDGKILARIISRQSGVLAGMAPARLAFHLADPRLVFTPLRVDGEAIAPGESVAAIEGPAASLLTAERTALNFLTHLSGVASQTARYVQAVAHTRARIAATRKTLSGLRALQKEAVLAGGGLPHRYGLFDAVLIKDNHIAAIGSVSEALRRARALAGHMRLIEIEVDNLAQLREVLIEPPHAILLDNFSLADLRAAVAMRQGPVLLEASGGVSLQTVAQIAETGVDIISVGALTHSAPHLDLGLDIAPG